MTDRTKNASALLFIAGIWICAVGSDARASGIAWRSGVESASAESAKDGKPMLVAITASWCHYCHRMFEDTFTNDQVVKTVNGCFIPVQVDADANRDFVRRAGVNGFPTTLILSPKLELIKKFSGYVGSESFLGSIKEICARRRSSQTQATTKPDSEQKPTIAYGGYCLVSMLDSQELRMGLAEYAVSYQGSTFQFASPARRDQFIASPTRYFPALDGRDAVTQGDKVGTVAGRPEFALIYRDRLWFCADESGRQQFLANPTKYGGP
jgi:thioredoxin-related protein/YHS domain-containing protein